MTATHHDEKNTTVPGPVCATWCANDSTYHPTLGQSRVCASPIDTQVAAQLQSHATGEITASKLRRRSRKETFSSHGSHRLAKNAFKPSDLVQSKHLFFPHTFFPPAAVSMFGSLEDSVRGEGRLSVAAGGSTLPGRLGRRGPKLQHVPVPAWRGRACSAV